MKKLLRILSRSAYAFLQKIFKFFGADFSVSYRKIYPADMNDPFKIFYIDKINLKMWIDYREGLDECYRAGVLDDKARAFLYTKIQNLNIKWFVDIGTNQGMYSLYLLSNFPELNVLNIEPDPYNLSKYKKNLEINNLTSLRVNIYEGAVCDSNDVKELDLMINTAGNRAGSSVIKDIREFTKELKNTNVRVKSDTLINLFKKFNVSNNIAIKIDIEGFEYPVLRHFFENADRTLWPKVCVVEALSPDISLVGCSPIELLIKVGYSLVGHEDVNFFFSLNN